ncbi:MAG: flavin reductase family protein [Myxococcaceae bacterium]
MAVFPPDNAEAYRELARRVAATVAVITTRLRKTTARPHPLDGFTATAFLMVSIDPPLVLISASNETSAAAMLEASDGLVINLLSATQMRIAQAFGRPQEERTGVFDTVRWSPDAWGVPRLHGALGGFSGRVQECVPAGDHTLVVARVTALHHGTAKEPLLYSNRTYGGWRAASKVPRKRSQ